MKSTNKKEMKIEDLENNSSIKYPNSQEKEIETERILFNDPHIVE